MLCVLDVHKDSVMVLLQDNDGRRVEVSTKKANRENMKAFLKTLPPDTTVVMESCYAWEYIYDLAVEMGFNTVVVDTGKLYPSGKPEKKNDLEDCKRLARLYRIGELPTVHVIDPARRQLRDLLRYRIFVTRKITSFRNHVHFTVDRLGLRMKGSELFGERATDPTKWPIDRCSMIKLSSCEKLLDALEAEEEAVEAEMARQILPNEDLQRLLTIPGFGLIIASAIYLEMGPVGRFATKEKLAAYAGLVPILEESDETTRHGRLRRRCNKYLRWAVIEGARHAIQCDARMRARYVHHLRAEEGRATQVQKAKAVVAVARHLLEIIWCMQTWGEEYRTPQKGVPEKKMRTLKQRARAYSLPLATALAKNVGASLEKETDLLWAPVGEWEGGWDSDLQRPDDDQDHFLPGEDE